MNRMHGVVCSSGWWAHRVERELLPWALADVELGGDVLELGPGFGATSSVLARRAGRLTVLELEERYCEILRRRLPSDVEVVHGDATALPFADDRFSAVVCFTMMHHLPSRAAQDKLLAEAARVLAPSGVLAGTDSLGTGALFRLLHVGDTLVPVAPEQLPARLRAAGLAGGDVGRAGRSFRFHARKPQAAAV
jgi:ubiquinone/menaquinone biosynthesis C-methylase UbiE